ncbi:MAG: SulP family inorganic anion transporter [Lewinellaceae bacterium]|nr:SulP family inorganic anion transporter [Lewinellaceae bacterium]
MFHKIFPFLTWWPSVNRTTLKADFLAGLTGAIIVLPQGIAFAIIAGMPPIYGLYTAMVIPVIAALWGSSIHLVSGPNTAISLVVFAAVSKIAAVGTPEYIQIALTLTFLAGVFQLALGLGRMGALVNFVSHVVITGFTAGAAIIIMESQLKNLLGLTIQRSDSFWQTLMKILANIADTNPYALGIGLFTLLISFLSKKWFPKLPNMLVALVLASVLAFFLGGDAVGIRLVGHVPSKLPSLSLPDFQFKTLTGIAPQAFAIAILGLIQSTAIARSIATKSQQQLDTNQEFIGQGLSNLIGSFFSSYAGAGSFTRSGLNYESGARTPVAVLFASGLLTIMVLFIAPLMAYLPIPAMAAIIIIVGYNLIDFPFSRTVLRASKRQSIVLIITFLSTLFLELEIAVYVGVIFSLIFYLQRTSTPNVAIMAPDPDYPNRKFIYLERKELLECPQLKMLRIDGSIFFGSVAHIAAEIRRLVDDEAPSVKHVLILAKGINFIDVAGSEWLLHEAERWKEKGGGLYFTGLKLIAQDSLIRGGFKKQIGEDHFFASKEEALEHICQRLDMDVCASCTHRIFLECSKLPAPSRQILEKEKADL